MKKDICLNCNKLLTIKGKGLCSCCYDKQLMDSKSPEICIGCNELLPILAKGLCSKCYDKQHHKNRKLETCIDCKELKIPKIRTENGIVCAACYVKNYQPKTKCSECGRLDIIREYVDDKPICKLCYAKTHLKICVDCGKEKKAYISMDNGLCRCEACHSRKRWLEDPLYATRKNLRSRVKKTLKHYIKTGKIRTSTEYGINYKEIILHLLPFPENIKDYNIDHIFPLSAFDLNNPVHIRAAFAPENHQWLLIKDNLEKSDHYNKEDFENYLKKFL